MALIREDREIGAIWNQTYKKALKLMRTQKSSPELIAAVKGYHTALTARNHFYTMYNKHFRQANSHCKRIEKEIQKRIRDIPHETRVFIQCDIHASRIPIATPREDLAIRMSRRDVIRLVLEAGT